MWTWWSTCLVDVSYLYRISEDSKLCVDISVDLRDAVGDRLFLSGHGLRRDGVRTMF